MVSTRRGVPRPFAFFAGLLAAVLIVPTIAFAASPASPSAASLSAVNLAGAKPTPQATLLRYVRDTWASFVTMTDPKSGLPADSLSADGTTSVQTSTTNIGAYMWSTVVADRLGIISHDDAVKLLRRTLHSLETMERDRTIGADGRPSGQFYNWYDHTTGAKLTIWPPTGAPINPPTARSCRPSTTAGSRPGCRSSRTASRRSRRARGRCSTVWTSASTTGRQ